MGFWVKFVYGQFRPQLVKWLTNNALNLNVNDTHKVAVAFGVSDQKVRDNEAAIAQGIINAIDAAVAKL